MIGKFLADNSLRQEFWSKYTLVSQAMARFVKLYTMYQVPNLYERTCKAREQVASGPWCTFAFFYQ